MTVRNHEQFTGQCPDGRRSWDAPVGVWGGKTYEELYVEHAPAARRLALSMVPPDAAEDVVAEAFAKVLAVIRAGGGPSHAFGGYLLTAVRHQATDWQRSRRRLTAVADMDVEADDRLMTGRGRVTPGIGSAAETQAAARDEARLVARAFGRLPSRWRAVLWELEVEGKAPAAVAPMFGLSANGVSALAMRAREGLRRAYLDEHVGTNIPDPCRAYAAEFGAGARGQLSQRRRAAMQEHLSHCHACQDLFTELTELNSRLGTILTPAALAAASAFMHSSRHAAIIRTSLSSPWRSWRLHPVTTTAGAAAGVVVAGGMLFAVNVTPFTGSPAHAATPPVAAQPAAASAVTPGSGTHRRGQGSGGGGSPAGTGSLAAPLTVAAAPAGGAFSSLPAAAATTGTVSPGTSADGGGAGSAVTGTSSSGASAGPGQTITITAGNTLTGLTSTAGTAVWGVTSAVGTAVPGVTSTVGGVVSGVTGTVGGVVSGVTGTVGGVVSGATGTVGGVVSGAASTAAGAVSGAAGAVSGAASAAGSTASGAVSQATSAVSSVASTVAATTTGAASTATPATSSANTVTAAADPSSPASNNTTAATSAAAGTAVAATTGIVNTAVGAILQ